MTYSEKNFSIIPNLATLANTSGHTDGQTVFVQTVKGRFIYSSNSSLISNGRTVLNTPNGGNTRWLFDTSFSHPDWCNGISDVYIDPVGGNDENQGIYTSTPGSPAPLKTAAELGRRWTGYPKIKSNTITFEIVIHIMNHVTAPDALRINIDPDPDAFFRILGEKKTTLRSGTLDVSNGFTAMNPTAGGGGTANIIKDSTLANFTPYIGKRIRFTATGSIAYILKDLGGNQARISVPILLDEPNFLLTPTISNPANGAAYVIEDITQVVFGTIMNAGPNVADCSITQEAGTFGLGITSDIGAAIDFYNCDFPNGIQIASLNTFGAGVIFSNCRTPSIVDGGEGFPSVNGGLCFLGGAVVTTNGSFSRVRLSGGLGDVGVIDWFATVQGGDVILHDDWVAGCFSVWDTPAGDTFGNPIGHAVTISGSDHRTLTSGRGFLKDRSSVPIFGNGAAGVGFRVGAGSSVVWEKLPNITGAAGDFRLGSGSKARFFNEGTGTYSNTITESWTNLNTAQPSGFGGSAHNMTDFSHLVKVVTT